MNIAYIMRGVPGSGKSTVAKNIAITKTDDAGASFLSFIPGKEDSELKGVYYISQGDGKVLSAIHSTDQYFLNDEGVYEFNRANLGKNHSKNYKSFRASCENDIPIVICDNTNLTKKEWKKYASCARNLGYIVSIISMPIPSAGVAAERNTHGVPVKDIKRMISRWESFDGKI